MREVDSRKWKVKRKRIDVVRGCVEVLRASSSDLVRCGRVEIFSDRAGTPDRACRSGHSGAGTLRVRRRIAGDGKLRGMDFAGGDA